MRPCYLPSRWQVSSQNRTKQFLKGLEKSGSVNDKNTVAVIEINGERFFGVNSTIRNNAGNNLGRIYFEQMSTENLFDRAKWYGGGQAQVLTHAEGHALMEAYAKYGDAIGNKVTIYCDRTTCPICVKYLPVLKNYLGIDELTVITSNGKNKDC